MRVRELVLPQKSQQTPPHNRCEVRLDRSPMLLVVEPSPFVAALIIFTPVLRREKL